MTGRTRKFVGIGCGFVLVLAIVVAGGLTWYSRELRGAYKEMQAAEEQLAEAQGTIAAYAPPTDGVPVADRVEVFLRVRGALEEWRAHASAVTDEYAAARGQGGAGSVWRRLGQTNDLAQTYAGFWQARNEQLLAAGMGAGEYMWYYGTIYYVWLGHDPEDGRQASAEVGEGEPPTWVVADWKRWRDAAAAGLPEGGTGVLEPYRGGLAASWNETINPIELIFAEMSLETE